MGGCMAAQDIKILKKKIGSHPHIESKGSISSESFNLKE